MQTVQQSSSMRSLRLADYAYVLLCSTAGVWQWRCFVYGADNIITVALAITMSLPFALASWWYARRIGTVSRWPDWKRMLLLWAGMPLSFAVGSMTAIAAAQVMLFIGVDLGTFPFSFFWIALAEAAACGAWTICLVVWACQPGRRLSRKRLLVLFAALFGGVLSTHALTTILNIMFHHDIYFLSTSVVATTISAMMLIFLSNNPQESGSPSSQLDRVDSGHADLAGAGGPHNR